MNIDEWRENTYKTTYESTRSYLRKLRDSDPAFGIKELEAQLQSEYDRQGLAWDGRGEVMELKIEATIAAMQAELSTWKKETPSPEGASS